MTRMKTQTTNPLITVNPDIAFGKPVIAGTRISVDFILQLFAAGRTTQQILAGYPHLTEEKIQAALEYAAARLRSEHVFILDKLSSSSLHPHEAAH